MKSKFVIIGVVAVVLVIVGVTFVKKGKVGVFPSNATAGEYQKIKGSAKAPVQIVEFSDFQCPACDRARPVLTDLLNKYPGKVAVTFKHFPLQGHLWAGISHHAAECANEQGKFWPFHDKLYDNQSTWSGPSHPLQTFLKYASQVGIDLDQFGTCLSNEEVQKRVLAERNEGVALKVRSTPTIFINDERIVGPIQLQVNGEKTVRSILGLPAEDQKEAE